MSDGSRASQDASAASSGDVLVVKLGGGAGVDPGPLLRDLAAHPGPWVLVHGGNAEMDDLSRKLGHEPRFVTSVSGHTSRVTDERTLAMMQMSYRGRINNDLVVRLQRLGVNAVGLSGVDGRIWQATRKEAIRIVDNGRKLFLRDDLTGKIHTVNTHLLRLLLDNGYRPVLTLPALADTGEAVNVDNDRAAAAVAAALRARDLVILSNVAGLLRDPADATSLVRTVARDGLDGVESLAQGRFKKKMLAVREALDGGVRRIVLGDARRATPLRDALTGQGTVIS